MLKHLRVKVHDVCNLLSNGSARIKFKSVYVYREQANVTKWQFYYSCKFSVDKHFFQNNKFFTREKLKKGPK